LRHRQPADLALRRSARSVIGLKLLPSCGGPA
jgi:hypothetical protein